MRRQMRGDVNRELPDPMAAILAQEHSMTPEAYQVAMRLATTELVSSFLETAALSEQLAVPMRLLRERTTRLRNREADSATQRTLTARNLAAGLWVTERFREITGPHVLVTLTNPFLVCVRCEKQVRQWHNPELCECTSTRWWNESCGHVAALTSFCRSWYLDRRCRCLELDYRDTPHRSGEWTHLERREASTAVTLATQL